MVSKDYYCGSTKVFYKLMGFDFVVEYKKGRENVVVDALSK